MTMNAVESKFCVECSSYHTASKYSRLYVRATLKPMCSLSVANSTNSDSFLVLCELLAQEKLRLTVQQT